MIPSDPPIIYGGSPPWVGACHLSPQWSWPMVAPGVATGGQFRSIDEAHPCRHSAPKDRGAHARPPFSVPVGQCPPGRQFHAAGPYRRRRPARLDPAGLARLTTAALPAFLDLRHDGDYPAPEGNAAELARATMAATDVVLVAPLYWYSLPAPAKLYLDHWSHWMRHEPLGFKAAMRASVCG